MVVMNAVCNKVLQPIDGSCCQALPAPSALQKLTAGAFLVCMVGFLVLHVLGYRHQRKTRPPVPPDLESGEEKKKPNSAVAALNSRGPLLSVCKMGLIMGYFYLCDRGDVFMKEQKFYTHSSFFIPLIYMFVLGIFYNENSKEVEQIARCLLKLFFAYIYSL